MTHRRRDARGQTLVEFALAISIFLVMVMAVVDLSRIVYAYNGTSEAAREITRATSVHPGSTLGSSAETAAVVATQQGLVPGLSVLSYACIDLSGATVSGTCQPGDWVRVTVRSRITPVTPALSSLGTIDITTVSSAQIE